MCHHASLLTINCQSFKFYKILYFVPIYFFYNTGFVIKLILSYFEFQVNFEFCRFYKFFYNLSSITFWVVLLLRLCHNLSVVFNWVLSRFKACGCWLLAVCSLHFNGTSTALQPHFHRTSTWLQWNRQQKNVAPFRISREIQCLPYAGFVFFILCISPNQIKKKKCLDVPKKRFPPGCTWIIDSGHRSDTNHQKSKKFWR